MYDEQVESSLDAAQAQRARVEQEQSVPVEQGSRHAYADTYVNTVYNNNLLGIPGMRELRSLELHLIHHYIAFMAYSSRSPFRASSNPITQPQNFPRLFYFIISNENVLFAACALAATHLLYEGSEGTRPGSPASSHDDSPASMGTPARTEIADPTTLARARDDYLFLALSEQREAVANLNAANINGVCFASMLIMTNEVAGLADRELEPYEPPMKWLQMGRGVGTVFDTARDKMGVLDPGWGSNVMHVVDPRLGDEQVALNALLRMGPMGQSLLTPTGLPGDDLSDETYEVYDYAVKYIGTLWQTFDNGADGRLVAVKTLAFPAWEPSEFVDFVAEGRPRALVTLAHMFRVAVGLDLPWWLDSVPEREILGIWQVLPSEWRFLMPEEPGST